MPTPRFFARMLIGLAVATGFACSSAPEKPIIRNRSFANFRELSVPMPPELEVIGASCSTDDSRAKVKIAIKDVFISDDGPLTVEAYFNAKKDDLIQSRVIVWTFGGYRFGSLDGTGTAAVFHRKVAGNRVLWQRLGDATAILDGNELELEGDLGVADAVPDIIVIRHAPAEFMKAHRGFRFSSDGIASTITFRNEKVHSRPLPRLPEDSDIVDR
ncbi:MAG: hypothetical protein U0R49_08355 [Fimbriimonadales bacterium]